MRSTDLFLLSTVLSDLHSVRVLSLVALVWYLYHFAAGTGGESLQGSRYFAFYLPFKIQVELALSFGSDRRARPAFPFGRPYYIILCPQLQEVF